MMAWTQQIPFSKRPRTKSLKTSKCFVCKEEIKKGDLKINFRKSILLVCILCADEYIMGGYASLSKIPRSK